MQHLHVLALGALAWLSSRTKTFTVGRKLWTKHRDCALWKTLKFLKSADRANTPMEGLLSAQNGDLEGGRGSVTQPCVTGLELSCMTVAADRSTDTYPSSVSSAECSISSAPSISMASSVDGSQVLPSQVPVASWPQVLVTSAFGSHAMTLKGGDEVRVERLVIGGDVVDDGDQTCPALACVALGVIDVADATGATLLHMACQRGLEVRSKYDL